MAEFEGAWEQDVVIPPLTPVRQSIHRQPIDPASIGHVVEDQWGQFGLSGYVGSGKEIAILVGSRGIADLTSVIAATVRAVNDAGGSPFVVPAMGSHGGATAEGQLEVLGALGIVEETIRCPIRATMQSIEIGTTSSGLPVHLDRFAADSDGLIVVNRVKPHTHFRGPLESGICKMLALGAGNHLQAQTIHSYGSLGLARLIPEFADVVLEQSRVIAGLALIEDGAHQLSHIEVLSSKDIRHREPVLLDLARSYLPRLPLEELDVLIVDSMGKNLSGTGMDTNVIGRVGALDFLNFDSPKIGCIIVLDLTEATHGNATGIGLADVVTARLAAKVDWGATYANALTAQSPRLAARPIVAPNDRAAIGAGIRLLSGPPRPEGQRIVRIASTLDLENIWLSPGALAAVQETGSIAISGAAAALQFSPSGDLAFI